MKILLALDKFKGSISSSDLIGHMANQILNNDKSQSIIKHPIADGGDGSVDVLKSHLLLENHSIEVSDPLGRKINTTYYTDKNSAYIEVAQASGLALLKQHEKNPMLTSTFGTGQLICDAINKGYKHIYLFLGGSATNDGGIGILSAMGFQFLTEKNEDLTPIGKNLLHIKQIISPKSTSFRNLRFTVLCDVKNTLCGPNGASYTYAKQKGASMEDIEILDLGLKNFADILLEKTQLDHSALKGSGAAGGIAIGLKAFFNVTLQGGFELIAAKTGLEEKIKECDVIITGEGKFDRSSMEGKVVGEMLNLANRYKKPIILICGQKENSQTNTHVNRIIKVYSLSDFSKSIQDSISNPRPFINIVMKKLMSELTTM